MSPDSHNLTEAGTARSVSTLPACRSCGGTHLESLLDLGDLPLADRLMTDAMLAEPEPRHPLELAFCGAPSVVCPAPPGSSGAAGAVSKAVAVPKAAAKRAATSGASCSSVRATRISRVSSPT